MDDKNAGENWELAKQHANEVLWDIAIRQYEERHPYHLAKLLREQNFPVSKRARDLFADLIDGVVKVKAPIRLKFPNSARDDVFWEIQKVETELHFGIIGNKEALARRRVIRSRIPQIYGTPDSIRVEVDKIARRVRASLRRGMQSNRAARKQQGKTKFVTHVHRLK